MEILMLMLIFAQTVCFPQNKTLLSYFRQAAEDVKFMDESYDIVVDLSTKTLRVWS